MSRETWWVLSILLPYLVAGVLVAGVLVALEAGRGRWRR